MLILFDTLYDSWRERAALCPSAIRIAFEGKLKIISSRDRIAEFKIEYSEESILFKSRRFIW
jgi:hypothetical protein